MKKLLSLLLITLLISLPALGERNYSTSHSKKHYASGYIKKAKYSKASHKKKSKYLKKASCVKKYKKHKRIKKKIIATNTCRSARTQTCPLKVANSNIRSESGFFFGGGTGGFWAAKAFQGRETQINNISLPDIQTQGVKKKPSGDPALVFNTLVGYRFNNYISADINGQYRHFKYNATRSINNPLVSPPQVQENFEQRIKNYSIFLNGTLSAPVEDSYLRPYITGGIGYAHNKAGDLIDIINFNNSDVFPQSVVKFKGKNTNNFAWNAGAGAKIKINEKFDLDVNYKYLSLGKVKNNGANFRANDGTTISSSPSSQRLKAHQIMVDLIYNF